MFLLLLPISYAQVVNSTNFQIDFTINPAVEESSTNFKVTSVINPFSNNESTYIGFLLLPVVPVTPAVAGGGDTSGAGATYQQQQQEKIKQEIQKIEQLTPDLCSKDIPFVKKLFSSCKVKGNNICDYG